MRLEVDTAKMWMRIACFAFRRAVKANGQEPDGIPFRRSKEAFCNGYEPRKKCPQDWDDWLSDAKVQYSELWDSINPKFPWSMNCWVWCYVFKFQPK